MPTLGSVGLLMGDSGDLDGDPDQCESRTIGSERLEDFTAWLRGHGYRAFLGEVGVANEDVCLDALEDMLGFMDEARDVWLGWAWWAHEATYALSGGSDCE